MYSKTVALPIEVPVGSYCWDGRSICSHFNNEGGYSRCELHLGDLKDDAVGVLKPKKCLVLVEIK